MRRKLLLSLCTFVMCCCFISAYAQEKTVTGVIYDEKGTSLPGATVRTPDSKHATQTDVNGKFTLSVPTDTKNLVVSFVGMQSKVVSIGNGGAFTVTLASLAGTLSDVVVIGYGSAKRANVT
jgi:TonB-dependent starch-binding outer membrane protein SusC